MKKQITSYFLSLLMVVSLVGVLPVLTASADISGDYAYEALGEITGQEAGEDLVNEIFSRFCMGK